MSEKRRLTQVVAILVAVAVLIGIISTYRQYQAGLIEKEKILHFQALSFASLIEAVAKFDRNTFKNKEKATAATLAQLEEAFTHKDDLDFYHEIQFVRKAGNEIEIFLRYEGDKRNPIIIAQNDKYVTEPVKQAVQGKNGSGIFKGKRDTTILAAYAYIDILQIGLVIEVDLWNLQRPYLMSGLNTAIAAAFILVIAAWFGIKLTNPIIAKLREQDMLNTIIVEAAYDALLILDEKGYIKSANPSAIVMLGYDKQNLVNKYLSLIFPPEKKSNGQLYEFLSSEKMNAYETTETIGLRKGQAWFPAMVSAAKKHSETGTLTVLIIHDLTKLREAEKTVRNLSQRILEIQDTEREKISRDIHDSLGSQLVALKLQIQYVFAQIGQEKSNQKAEVLKNFDEAIEQVRNISFMLSPFALNHLNLKQALTKLSRKFPSLHSGIQFHSNISISDRKIEAPDIIQIYRIAQEALQNALKHSQAKNIWLSATETDQSLMISIRDDGRGFDMSQADNMGQGLLIMKERTTMIGAELKLQTAIQGGCEVLLVITHKE